MDNKTIFVLTLKGEGEIKSHTRYLPEDVKRTLALIDDESTVEKLMKRAAPSLRSELFAMLRELAKGGFIQYKDKARNVPRMATPKIPTTANMVEVEGEELDFTITSEMHKPTPEILASEAAKAKAQIEVKTKTEAETKAKARTRERQEEDEWTEQFKAEQEVAKARAEAEATRFKAEQEGAAARAQLDAAKAKAETEARIRAEVEAARLKAVQEAAVARAQLEVAKAEVEAKARTEAKARAEVEAARLKAVQEAATKAQLEAALAKAEADAKTKAEAKARAEVEARARQEAETARLKAEQEVAKARAEVEAARLKAVKEAAVVKAQLEAAKAMAETEAKARADAETRSRQEADSARFKAEQEIAQAKADAVAARLEAEQARAEVETLRNKAKQVAAEAAARAKQEAEARAKQEAEAKAKQEAEARAKQEAEARAKQEAEARAKQEAEARAKQEAEARAKQEAEARAKQEAEARAKQEAEARAKQEAEARAKQEAEARAKQEAEARAKQEAEARAKQEAEAKAKQEAEARAKQEAEARAKQEAEARAKQEAEARAKQEAEARAKQEAEAKAKQEAEARAKQEAEAKAKQEAEARAKQEAEAKAKQEAEARAKQEAEARAKQEAEARAKQEAEARAKQEAEARAKQEAEARAKQEAEARAKQEAEARAKQEAEARARQIAQAARLKAEQDIARTKSDAEARIKQITETARLNAEQDIARTKSDAEARIKQITETACLNAEQDIARTKSDAEAELVAAFKAHSEKAAAPKADVASASSMVATVLFFDVEGFTRQSVPKQIELKAQFGKLVTEFTKDIDESQRIILDTGDGAAIGFLQHPEDAIEVALNFRHAVTANNHRDYPELLVRMGINLGPVNVVKGMNGQNNMVGDGINDAQCIMSFAPSDNIYISRSYFDVVSRLTTEYTNLFKYRGMEKDQHGREHQVYEVLNERPDIFEQPVEKPVGRQKPTLSAIKLEPFALPSLDKTTATVGNDVPKTSPAGAAPQPEMAVQKAQIVESEAAVLVEIKPQQDVETVHVNAGQEADKINADAAATTKATEAERKMGEAQARIWAEAEQRAKEQATAQASQSLQASTVHRIPKRTRQPLPWGKISSGLFSLAVALVAALPYFWPMQDYVAQIEKNISAQLLQPVHIGHLKAAFFPLPKLELQDVSVGRSQEMKADNVVLNFGISALFSEVKAISKIEIDNLRLSSESFDKALGWVHAAGGDAHYPVALMVLRHANVSGEGLNLPPINGSADMDAQGHFTKVALSSEDGKLGLELKRQQSRWQASLNIKESNLPMLPGILFNEFNARGEVGEGFASFNEIDGRMYGGVLTGDANLSWKNGWQLQGRMSVKRLELQKALPQFGIEGEMDGETSFKMNEAKLHQLANTLHMDGNFVVWKGVINNIDMVETVTNRKGAIGGRTHFDQMIGLLQADSSGQHLRQVKISAGVMSANGFIDVSPDRQLSGRLSIDLKMRAGMGSVPLSLGGVAGKPVLR